MVYYYYQVLELKANFELQQTWNLFDRPLDMQKPLELKKQKPDEKKNNKRKQYRQPITGCLGKERHGSASPGVGWPCCYWYVLYAPLR